LPVKWLLRRRWWSSSDVATINRMHGRHSTIRRFEQWMEGASSPADHVIATNQALAVTVRKRNSSKSDQRRPTTRARRTRTAQAHRRLADDRPARRRFVIATSGVFAADLVALVARLAESTANAHPVVIGQGTDGHRGGPRYARSGGNGRASTSGWREDVGAVPAVAICSPSHPSRRLAASLIEVCAPACRAWAVTSPDPWVPGEDTACLFDPDDVEALRARIENGWRYRGK
jgi:hypothetical protein